MFRKKKETKKKAPQITNRRSIVSREISRERGKKKKRKICGKMNKIKNLVVVVVAEDEEAFSRGDSYRWKILCLKKKN